jgi:SAM-dependent methyltransferase
MAKILMVHSGKGDTPDSTETIEVRAWALAGTEKQILYLGSGFNYQASANVWLEITYTVEDVQIFYTRNFLHQHGYRPGGSAERKQRLDALVEKGEGKFSLGDIMPETSLTLSLKKLGVGDEHEGQPHFTICNLEISLDTGTVFGRSAPGERSIDLVLPNIEVEDGVRFLREIIDEIDEVVKGKHPDPAVFVDGASDWPLVEQLNRKAYDKISEDYQEAYFENPLLVNAFEGWLAQLPPGGSILDAGCGHGDPVVGKLLEKGFQVTGSDLSPRMLERVHQSFPQVRLIEASTPKISEQAAFDGICSFNSFLYLDPIDLLHSILRLQRALKPGGLLFLYGFDSGPDWRGEPFGHRIGQWMWSWHYGIQEAASLLEEHGYFQVLETCVVQTDPKEAQRIAQKEEEERQKEAEYLEKQAISHFPVPYPKLPINRSPYAYVISARRS